MKNTTNLKSIENIDYVENFFKIRIGKIMINNDKFKIFYKTFLNERDEVDKENVKSFVNTIYEKISKYDITNIRPNNINILDESIAKKVISSFSREGWDTKFADDLYTFLEWRHSDLWLKIDYFIHDDTKTIEKVNFWINNYIKDIYIKLNEWNEFLENSEIKLSIEYIEKNVLEVLKWIWKKSLQT